jgi:uncharacterized phage infection (PIP) family protein YhgE
VNSLRLLASPRIWGPVPGIVAMLALVFYAYLGSVVSPEKNLEYLPMALVNEDRGGDLAGTEVKIGDCVGREVLGCLISLFRDVFARREHKEVGKVAETAG